MGNRAFTCCSCCCCGCGRGGIGASNPTLLAILGAALRRDAAGVLAPDAVPVPVGAAVVGDEGDGAAAAELATAAVGCRAATVPRGCGCVASEPRAPSPKLGRACRAGAGGVLCERKASLGGGSANNCCNDENNSRCSAEPPRGVPPAASRCRPGTRTRSRLPNTAANTATKTTAMATFDVSSAVTVAPAALAASPACAMRDAAATSFGVAAAAATATSGSNGRI